MIVEKGRETCLESETGAIMEVKVRRETMQEEGSSVAHGLRNEDRRSSIGCAKAKDLADEALSMGWWPQPAGEASEGTGRKEVETVSKSACGIETVRSLRRWVVRRGLCDSGGKYCIPYAGGITKEKGGHSLEKTAGRPSALAPAGGRARMGYKCVWELVDVLDCWPLFSQ